MADFKPTARLRWVVINPVPDSRFGKSHVSFRMLQQWWQSTVPDYMRSDDDGGEWRDVPTEVE
jgi:hypothetical protein